MNQFIIAYDIFEEKRLRSVRKIAYSYALGGQKSALEAALELHEIRALVSELNEIIVAEDQINLIKFTHCITLGKAEQLTFHKNGIVIL